MKHRIVVILDSVAGLYSHPQFVNTHGSAVRSFLDVCKDQSSPIGKHPADYSLWALGEYDDETAQFEALPKPELLVRGEV